MLTYYLVVEGRLQQSSLDLLAGSSIHFRRSPRLDITLVQNLPIAIIFLPAADIPTFVGEGRVDLGITGRDQVAEHEATSKVGTEDNDGVEEVTDLGFGSCKLQVQVPENGSITDSRQLVGRNVVTSFTGLTERYFRELEAQEGEINGESKKDKEQEKTTLRTKIKYVGGSVEAACALGVADGIVDLVGMFVDTKLLSVIDAQRIISFRSSHFQTPPVNHLNACTHFADLAPFEESGETMKAAGLKPIDTVLTSTAVLIKSKHPSNPKLLDLIASRIRGFITAQSYVLCQYNIPRRLLPVARRLTPGKRAPTVTALDGTGIDQGSKDGETPGTEGEEWVAISSMVEKKKIAAVMDQLTENGASDILVLEIANTRTA